MASFGITRGDRACWQWRAATVRATLEARRQALSMSEYRERPGGDGTTYLHAGRRGLVRVGLSATVSGDTGEQP